MEMTLKKMKLDYRNRADLCALDEIRDALLTRRDDVEYVDLLVDTERFAAKAKLYADIIGLRATVSRKSTHWETRIYPPECQLKRLDPTNRTEGALE